MLMKFKAEGESRLQEEKRVAERHRHQSHQNLNDVRKDQIGSGMRGDKIRTYREQDDVVSNHLNNKKTRLKDILKGCLDQIW